MPVIWHTTTISDNENIKNKQGLNECKGSMNVGRQEGSKQRCWAQHLQVLHGRSKHARVGGDRLAGMSERVPRAYVAQATTKGEHLTAHVGAKHSVHSIRQSEKISKLDFELIRACRRRRVQYDYGLQQITRRTTARACCAPLRGARQNVTWVAGRTPTEKMGCTAPQEMVPTDVLRP